jgi:hypothetical protein
MAEVRFLFFNLLFSHLERVLQFFSHNKHWLYSLDHGQVSLQLGLFHAC